MRYRRNADTRLRQMEREWVSTGNIDLLIPINRERRRVGLPPHPDARIILANNGLLDWIPKFASQLSTLLEVYDEIDIPMHIAELPEEGLREQVIALTDEMNALQRERRACSRAITNLSFGGDLDSEYAGLLSRHGVSPIQLGEIQKIEEDEELREGEMRVHFFSRKTREQQTRSGHKENLELWGWMFQLISRRALRIYRKLLTYGALPVAQIINVAYEGTTIAENWFESELNDLDELADKIEIASNEILDVTQRFGPSPEAIELFSSSWYKDED